MDYFNKIFVCDVIIISGEICVNENDVVVNVVMDRVFGGVESINLCNVGCVFEQVEDKEDVVVVRVVEKEIQEDEVDFLEQQFFGVLIVRNGILCEGMELLILVMMKLFGFGLFFEFVDDGEVVEVEEKEVEYNVWGERMQIIDDYMFKFMMVVLEGMLLDLLKDKKKSKKKGKDIRKRQWFF